MSFYAELTGPGISGQTAEAVEAACADRTRRPLRAGCRERGWWRRRRPLPASIHRLENDGELADLLAATALRGDTADRVLPG